MPRGHCSGWVGAAVVTKLLFAFWNALFLLLLLCLKSVGTAAGRASVDTWPASPPRLQPVPLPLQVMYAPRPRDRFAAPTFLPRDRFSRFQPTYPYVQHDIDLPPTISLSDGEEPPPYQGPCALQLRDPEQQRELNRESVRAPPNRTIFDSDLLDVAACSAGPCPPSSHSGISASTCSSHGRMEGPPPAYSEVMGRPPGAALLRPQQGALRGGGPVAPQDSVGGPGLPAQAKDRKPGNLA